MVTHPSSDVITQAVEPLHRRAQGALAATDLGHRFDQGVGPKVAARLLGMSRATFDRRLPELVARGLVEMPRLTRTRIFSALSCERVLHGLSVRQARRGR